MNNRNNNPSITKYDKIINLNDEDGFGTLKKVKVIEESLLAGILNEHKIIVLFGVWGSGKSSVTETLNHNLKNNEGYITIKFDTWEYKNEENIAYALLCYITNKLENDKDTTIRYGIKSIKNEILKSGAVVLKSVGVNTGLFKLNFECNDERYKEVENLKKNGFNKISELLNENNKRLIVFIDELDRCERENILKFLASLKLFFTSGVNINYVCAVDKEAVAEALKHKYSNGEKAEEYLEKIFNFSFNMPKTFDVKKFIVQYNTFNDYNAEKLAKLFKAINFTTPRRLKKVLNKYEYLVKLKTSNNIGNDFKNLIPDIITENNNKDEIFI